MQARLGYAVRAAMIARHMSASELARAVRRDPSTVTRWMNGETVPNVLILKQLADALRVKPELFYDPPPLPDYPIDEYLLD